MAIDFSKYGSVIGSDKPVQGSSVSSDFTKYGTPISPTNDNDFESGLRKSFGVKDNKTAETDIPSFPHADEALKNTYQDYSKAIPNFLNEAGRQDESTSKNPIIRTGENALGATASGINTVFSPITNAVKQASDSFAESDMGHAIENNPTVGKLLDLFGKGSNKLEEWSQQHPEAARNLNNLLTVGLSATGEGPVNKVGEGIKDTGKALGTESVNVASDIKNMSKPVIDSTLEKGKDLISSTKDKVFKTPTIDETVGRIVQGTPEDIPAAKRTLTDIDTTGVTTQEQLLNKLDEHISNLDKAKQGRLNSSPIYTKPLQLGDWERAMKVGDTIVRHNYVEDGLNQLRDYYKKTNDIPNSTRIENLINKAENEGLTINEVDKIAKEHGTKLNAYNSSGELASGLTKQAAENTRNGIKATAREVFGDKAYEAIDSAISDTIRTRDLIKEQVDAVNKLSQRLQKPNIFQKIGAITGKALRITGVGDLAQKLLGIEKVPGASTLNAVELEAQLSKNLNRIKDALKKDDEGFIKDIEDISQSQNNPIINNTTNAKTNNPANPGESASSIKNNNKTNIQSKSSTFEPKSKTGQLIKSMKENYDNIPNKQGGHLRITGDNPIKITDSIRDKVSKELNNFDNSTLKVNGKLDLSNSDKSFRIDHLKTILEKRALNSNEINEVIDLLGIKVK